MREIEVAALEAEKSSSRSKKRSLVGQALRKRSDQSVEERGIRGRETLEVNKSQQRRKKPQGGLKCFGVETAGRLQQSRLTERYTKLERRAERTLKHRE